MVAAQATNRSSSRRAGASRARALGTRRSSAVTERPTVRRVCCCTAVTQQLYVPGPLRSDACGKIAQVNTEPTSGQDSTGVLVLAGTPIGRLADAPAPLAEELATADVVAAEDPRRLRRLTTELGVTPAGRVVSYFEGNES